MDWIAKTLKTKGSELVVFQYVHLASDEYIYCFLLFSSVFEQAFESTTLTLC
ncbi:MAG: hypothetical protein ACI8ZB_004314 [Desulforhopalus sp.]|jgi:hypothetical protein